MIVCRDCGLALAGLDRRCSSCSGRAVEKHTPFTGFLTPSQQRDSPDRWAKSYTSSTNGEDHFNISTDRTSGGLARVFGTVLEPNVNHPTCAVCKERILPGSKLYLASRDLQPMCLKGNGLCRPCFKQHFQLGTCEECQGPILGEKEEGGQHMSGRHGAKWHARCFACHRCRKPLMNDDHCLLPSGEPSCIGCLAITIDGCGSQPLAIPQPEHGRSRSQRSQIQKSNMTANELTASTVAREALHATKQGKLYCPGCRNPVAKFEINVVPGPKDTRWHHSCLRCGRGGIQKGCEKQLDMGASMNSDGTILCRACSMSHNEKRSP